jgi:cysteine desulfurase
VAYLDHAATTPLRAEAVAAMLPYLTEHFGNPSGSHAVARRAKVAIEDARDVVAAALGCAPHEVVFTGSGTEADNLAITGVVAAAGAGATAICTAVEHHAVLHTTEHVGGGGGLVAVDANGVVDLDHLRQLLTATPSVAVVSVMLANNEVGTVQPLDPVADVVRRHAPMARLHTDAVQAFPWLDVAHEASGADLVAVSAHKFGGPKGVGALVVRNETKLAPLLLGGGQEQERRSGTHNVAGIVGMAAAMEATVRDRDQTVARVRVQRDRLLDALLATVPDTTETGDRRTKVAGNAHVRFAGVESEALLFLLDEAGVCASAGSACASGAIEPSHVLTAMGVSADDARTSVRLSLGATTTDDDVDQAAKVIAEAVARLRTSR